VEPSNPYFDYAFTFIFMFLLGIPHGAGDHLLIQKQKKDQGLSFSLLRFMGSYLAVMLLYALLWYYFPRRCTTYVSPFVHKIRRREDCAITQWHIFLA
jgi:hypothetical protein